jgi:hypothetical protein
MWKGSPWGRIYWMLQIVVSGIQELDAQERKHFGQIAKRAYRDRRLDPKDRKHLVALARKVSRGAARGARGGAFLGRR